jgi:O-antigen/teichoic acid export membrane protein
MEQLILQNLSKKILVGSLQIAGGQGASQLLSFARNLFIARLIGPDQFGLGLTCVLIVTFVEMASDMSWQKFIVQDDGGEDPRVQATLHTFFLIRGALIAAALWLGAELLTRALGVPAEFAWTYRALALVPVFTGLSHLDVKRFHRYLRYAPDVVTQALGNLAGIIVGVVIAATLGDYRAILVSVIVRDGAAALLSHLLADWPYRIGYSPVVARRAWVFGWPLLINGFLLFASNQGDRAVIVRAFGTAVFGIYGATALVTQSIASLVLTVIGSIGLPILAGLQHSPDEYAAAYNRLGSISAVAAVSVCVPLFAVLPILIPLLYGASFEVPHMLTALLVVILMVIIFRNWGTVAALSVGASHIVMLENLVRTAGIGLALLAVILGGELIAVASALLVGELIGTAMIFVVLRASYGFGLEWATVLFGIVASVGATCLMVEGMLPVGNLARFAIYPAILGGGLGALYLASAEVRGLARDLRAVVVQ